jgi:hypothetical protein
MKNLLLFCCDAKGSVKEFAREASRVMGGFKRTLVAIGDFCLFYGRAFSLLWI